MFLNFVGLQMADFSHIISKCAHHFGKIVKRLSPQRCIVVLKSKLYKISSVNKQQPHAHIIEHNRRDAFRIRNTNAMRLPFGLELQLNTKSAALTLLHLVKVNVKLFGTL